MAKRPRNTHYITGFGDGHVREASLSLTDDILYRKSRRYVRGGKQAAPSLQKQFEEEDRVYNLDVFQNSHNENGRRVPLVQEPWLYSAMVLLAVMGLLVALFLHLVTDSSPVNRKRRPTTLRKKKTDDWSDDCEMERYYSGDHDDTLSPNSRAPLFYPYPRQYPTSRHRKSGSLNSNSHFPGNDTALSGSYRSPSNSYYNLQPQQHTPQQSHSATTTPHRGRVIVRPLSPVSSFEKLSEVDEERPLQSGAIARGKVPSIISNESRRSSRLGASPGTDDILQAETPRAGMKQRRTMAAHAPLAPSLSPALKVPFMPTLADICLVRNSSSRSFHVDDLAAEMESGNLQHYIDFSQPDSRLFFPQLIKNKSTTPQTAASDPDDPRRNIIHKRQNLTHSTDSASSLASTSIAFSELSLEEIIGGGGFGQVWRAKWRGTPVAVKVLTGSAQRENVSTVILQEFAAEINMLRGMRHPNICLYMGASLDPPNRAIITELAANGSLWDALRLPLQAPYVAADGLTMAAWPLELYDGSDLTNQLPPVDTWPWVLVKRVAFGAARGMTYLHSGVPPVLHRDLKSANLLLDESYTAKVCDFGLSRLKAQERSMTGNCGTVQWMAPEILANQPYAEPADVFSFGIILWELLTAECPYEGMSAIQCALAVLNRDYRPEIPKWCPPQYAALIRACIEKDTGARPTFSQIILALDAMP